MERKLNCGEVLAHLDDYLDRELSPAEAELVTRHFSDCAVCAAEHHFEAGILSSVKDKLRRIRLPDEVRQRLLARLRDAGS